MLWMKKIGDVIFIAWLVFAALGESRKLMLVLIAFAGLAALLHHNGYAVFFGGAALLGYIAAGNPPKFY